MLLFDTSERAARSVLRSAVSLGVAVCGHSLLSGPRPSRPEAKANLKKKKKKIGERRTDGALWKHMVDRFRS